MEKQTMPVNSLAVTPKDIADLRLRTEYEVWLLEQVYKIVDDSSKDTGGDELVYPLGEKPLVKAGYMSFNISLFSWQDGFLQAGAPLIFVTAFKLLDMLMEWVLVLNGKIPNFRFCVKIRQLDQNVKFPNLIATKEWLRDRLLALYEQLEPLRGTIIHAQHFDSQKGELRVSSSKGGVIGPEVTINQSSLRNLALSLVIVVRHLEGRKMSALTEKSLRRMLDEIGDLHQFKTMGQLPPSQVTVRMYVLSSDQSEIDISRIDEDIAQTYPDMDMIYKLRIVVFDPDAFKANAYLLPWESFHSLGKSLSLSNILNSKYEVALPNDVNLQSLMSDMAD